MAEKTSVSLILGSGGARGLTHIGIIHWLEEHGFEIQSISGCSIGALVGGIYAAGKLDEFEAWIRTISKVDMFNLLDLAWQKSGLVKGDKIIATLMEMVGQHKIEYLPIKYTAVAADILNEKEVWMNSGSLFDAIRASISLPLFFTPFPYQGVDLIDGGVLNPVPIAPSFGDNTDLTIAVNLGGMPDNSQVIVRSATDEKQPSSSLTQQLSDFFDKLTDSAADKVRRDWNAYDVANQAFDAMQSTIARQKLAAYPADHFIEIARNTCGMLEFDLAPELIDLGYHKASQSLGQLISESTVIAREREK